MMTTTPAAVTTGGQAAKPLVGGRAGKEEATQAQEQEGPGAELKMQDAAGSQDDGKKMGANIEFKSIYIEMNLYGEPSRETTTPQPGVGGNSKGFALPPFSSQNPVVPPPRKYPYPPIHNYNKRAARTTNFFTRCGFAASL